MHWNARSGASESGRGWVSCSSLRASRPQRCFTRWIWRPVSPRPPMRAEPGCGPCGRARKCAPLRLAFVRASTIIISPTQFPTGRWNGSWGRAPFCWLLVSCTHLRAVCAGRPPRLHPAVTAADPESRVRRGVALGVGRRPPGLAAGTRCFLSGMHVCHGCWALSSRSRCARELHTPGSPTRGSKPAPAWHCCWSRRRRSPATPSAWRSHSDRRWPCW